MSNKLSNKQLKEIEILKFFIPKNYIREITDEDVINYLNWSEKGKPIKKFEYRYNKKTEEMESIGNALTLGKMWREVHIDMYKKEFEGPVCTFFLWEAKEEFPPVVFEFICKSLVGSVPLELR